MNTKKITFFLSILGSVLFALMVMLGADSCYVEPSCRKVREILGNDSFSFVFIFPILLLLSLATYRMKEEVFRAWWNFARWWVPLIVIWTVLANTIFAHKGGYNFADSPAWSTQTISIEALYFVFVFVSLWKIVRTYLKTKQ